MDKKKSFMSPIVKNKVIKQSEIFGIFANITDILEIHQKFCKKLYQRFEDTKLFSSLKLKKKKEIKIQDDPKDKENINKEDNTEDEEKSEEEEVDELEEITFQDVVLGDLFEELASNLKVYVDYCNNYNISAKLTEELKFRDQNYSTFVTKW